MNMDNHVAKHFKFFNDLIKGDGDSAEAHRKFYNEYLAVMDMPAHYYLDTIRKVFLEHQLPRGEMQYRGEKIDLTAIKKMALMTVEGELDDITGVARPALRWHCVVESRKAKNSTTKPVVLVTTVSLTVANSVKVSLRKLNSLWLSTLSPSPEYTGRGQSRLPVVITFAQTTMTHFGRSLMTLRLVLLVLVLWVLLLLSFAP